jgi:hypothetical protein
MDFKKELCKRFRYYKFKLRINFVNFLYKPPYPYKPFHDRNACIFIHIPKNAGTSIISLLNNGEETEQEHNSYWDFLRADKERFNRYFSFCVVRNPWDRLLSAYTYLSKGGNGDTDINLSNEINNSCRDFSDFVLNWLTFEKIYSIKLLNPQYIYIQSEHTGKIMVSKLLKYENLQIDFEDVRKQLNLTDSLSWLNSSGQRRYQDFYNPELIKKVEHFYSTDIKMLGYAFDEDTV